MKRIFATAALCVALTAGSASAGVSFTTPSWLKSGGTFSVSWTSVAVGTAAVIAGGYVVFNSIRLLNGASGG